MTMTEKQKRGFALMDPDRRRELAKEGGKKVHEMGKRHSFTPEEARAAGKKGGRGRPKQPSVETAEGEPES
jgi:general stress protein YciG